MHYVLYLKVTGELQDHLTSWDTLRAALPVGTVSGAPKVHNFPDIFLSTYNFFQVLEASVIYGIYNCVLLCFFSNLVPNDIIVPSPAPVLSFTFHYMFVLVKIIQNNAMARSSDKFPSKYILDSYFDWGNCDFCGHLLVIIMSISLSTCCNQ